jgi:hypothetical protein
MWCWDGESCHDRYTSKQYWMSSTTWPAQMAQGGIFGLDNSGWATANRVYVKYCSSDLWAGDVAASTATWGYAFRGTRIVAATITSLVTTYGMGKTAGERLLFGGCSAGAIGAMNNLDAVAAQVPASMQVQGLLDAASLVDVRPAGWAFSNDVIPLQTLMAELVAAITPVFAPTCAARHNGAGAWKCLLGQYRMPLLETPFFANIPQIDDFELMYDSDNLAPITPAQLTFVGTFQTAVLALIAALPTGTGIFSPTCLVHCLSGQPSYQALKVNNVSMSEALDAWYFSGANVQVISACSGWACTAVCGATKSGVPCNAGTGYATTQCFPLNLPNNLGPDEPPNATDATGVAIPGESTTSESDLPTKAVTGTIVEDLDPFAAAALGGSGSAARKSSHGASTVMAGAAAGVVAAVVLCLASRQAIRQAMPAERKPLLPRARAVER